MSGTLSPRRALRGASEQNAPVMREAHTASTRNGRKTIEKMTGMWKNQPFRPKGQG